jgi:hypothetical protein
MSQLEAALTPKVDPADEALVDALAQRRMAGWTTKPLAKECPLCLGNEYHRNPDDGPIRSIGNLGADT